MDATFTASDPAMQLPEANIREDATFSPEEFETIENVPIFAEHETTSKDGRPISFGYQELKAVADRSNRRIAETGDYAGVTIGHTPSPEAKSQGASDPDLIGFAGPFRIGTLGREGSRKRFAILADLHVFRDELDRFRRHPRRSPELWLEDKYEDMFLDPIALLGAEAPRLDLGLLYSAARHGLQIEKYAAASPAPSSVFIPEHVGDESKRYQSPGTNEAPIMLSDEDLRQIVDAVETLPAMQWARQQMSTGLDNGQPEPPPEMPAEAPPMGEAAPPIPPPAEPPPTGESPPAPMAEAAPKPPVPPAEPAAAPPQDEEKLKMYAALDELEDDEIEEYMSHRKAKYESIDADSAVYETAEQGNMDGKKVDRDEVSGPEAYEAGGTADADSDSVKKGIVDGVDDVADGKADETDRTAASYATYAKGGEAEKYQKLQVELRTLSDTVGSLKNALVTEQSKRVDAERRQRLHALHSQGFTIDPEQEMQRLCYSKMNDEQFQDSVEFIVGHCQRMPMHELPYSPDSALGAIGRPGGTTEREKYSRDQNDKARRIAERKAISGEEVDYAAILEAVANGTAE